MSTQPKADYEDFYGYTGGRWLWNEKQQLEERYKWFDVEELKRIAASSVGAQTCVSISKLAEGGNNKVFRLTMDDDSTVIARVPNPNAGPAFRTTASEVATMDFAKSALRLPVPKVFAWSANPANLVGSEYIIMEEAPGIQLGNVWDEMGLSDQLKVVEDLVAIEKKCSSISFTLYGNLFFAADAFPGCEKAEIIGDIPDKNEVESRFVIGPVVDRDFWTDERASMDICRGPWNKSQEYLRAIAQREIAWISRHATNRPLHGIVATSEAQRSPEAHIALYKKFLSVCHALLPNDEKLLRPTLWHCDLHAPNIFVDADHHVTSLIDWQGAWEPLLLEIPECFKDLDDAHEKARIQTRVAKSIALWTYESETRDINPDLHKIFQTAQGRNMRDTVAFATDTWNTDIIPFRQCLIRIERHWNELHVDGLCPIHFSDGELKQHQLDGEGWNERADFWESLEGLAHRHGWTSNETYEQALEMFAQLREAGLRDLTGMERTEFEKQTKWAIRSTAALETS